MALQENMDSGKYIKFSYEMPKHNKGTINNVNLSSSKDLSMRKIRRLKKRIQALVSEKFRQNNPSYNIEFAAPIF